jgi:hypothetical protein
MGERVGCGKLKNKTEISAVKNGFLKVGIF